MSTDGAGGEVSLVRCVQRGAWCDVHEGRLDGARVAIKLLGGGARASAVEAKRFFAEVGALEAVTSRHVVRALRVLGSPERPCGVAFPWLVGETLRERLASGPLDEVAAVRIVAEVLAGLEAIHAVGLVHRDLKPSNVFIGHEEGEPSHRTRALVIDLGLAVSLWGEGLTSGGHVVGTLAYLAPERVLAGRADARTDVWGAGVIFLEALSGRAAFDRDDALAVLESDPVLQAIDGAVGPALAALVRYRSFLEKALAKRPRDRFADAAAMRAALLATARQEGEVAA